MPETLLGFLREMEFATLTKRIAEGLGAEVPPPDRAARRVGAKRTPACRTAAPRAAPDKANGAAPGEDSPQAAVAAISSQAARACPIDRSKYETVTDLARLEAWIAQARAAGRFAFDTETTSLDPMQADFVGFSMAVAPGEACYVPLGHRAAAAAFDFGDGQPKQVPVGRGAGRAEAAARGPRRSSRSGRTSSTTAWCWRRHGIALAPLDDTMLLSYALDGGRGQHGMDALSERHLGHTCIPFTQVLEHAPGAKKSDKTFAQVPLDKATEYAAEDADVTLRLWHVLKPRLAAERMTTVYETLERPLVRVLADMERAGIKVDRSILSRLTSTFAQRSARLEEEIYELAGHKFNLGSPKQLGEFLFDNLKLPGGKKTKTGQWETRAGLLDDLAASEDLPEDARKLINVDARMAAAVQADVDLHRRAAAATSMPRPAASTPPTRSPPPRRAGSPPPSPTCRTSRSAPRKAARSARPSSPSTGHKLISADYSQIELRVLAHIADIPQLRKAFAEGLDIHAMTASEMFGVPVKDMPAEVRRRAKAINFGIIYGISAFGLAAQLGISKQEAGDYIKTYFKRFPGIRDYMDGDQEARARAGLRGDHLRPAHPLSRDQHQEPVDARLPRARRRSTRRSRARPPTSSAAP